MKASILLKLIATTSMISLAYAASAGIITLSPKIQGFNQVDLQSSGQVLLRQGNQDRIQVQIPEQLAPYMNIYRSGKVLHLGVKDHPFQIFGQPIYLITMRHIRGLIDRNSGTIQVQTPIFTNYMNLVLHNSGQINIPNLKVDGTASLTLKNSGYLSINQLQAQSTSIYLANSGQISVSHLRSETVNTTIRNSGHVNLRNGRVKQEDITLKNSGHYQAPNLIARNAKVHMRNSGNIAIHVNKHLDIYKRGSGELYVYGSPKMRTFNVKNASGIHMMHQ